MSNSPSAAGAGSPRPSAPRSRCRPSRRSQTPGTASCSSTSTPSTSGTKATQFEPMKDFAELTPEERQYDYRNPRAGDYRLRHLQSLMRPVVDGIERSACRRRGRAARYVTAPVSATVVPRDACALSARVTMRTVCVPSARPYVCHRALSCRVWRDVGVDLSGALAVEEHVGAPAVWLMHAEDRDGRSR